MEFLDQKENIRVMNLWRRVFQEDSPEFIRYYIENKLEKNLILARKENEEVISMVHLTPYTDNRGNGVCYIVGVATDERYRRKGYMDSLLKKALKLMFLQGMPYTFLMPAKAEYYTPYDFTYIYNKKKSVLKASLVTHPDFIAMLSGQKELAVTEVEAESVTKQKPDEPASMNQTVILQSIEEKDAGKAALLAIRLLRGKYDLYLSRNAEYYRTLIRELRSQNGALIGIYENGRLTGLLAVTDQKGSLQEMIMEREDLISCLACEEQPKPAIMGRILNVPSVFAEAESEQEFVMSMKITDELIPENNGVFLIHCGPEGGHLEAVRLSEGDMEANGVEVCHCECETTIADLTSFLFGYRSARECFTIPSAMRTDEIVERLNRLKVIRRISITETV